MKIFITGGLGYIGTAFTQKALQKGYKVMLYDSLLYEQDHGRILAELTKNKKRGSSVELVIGDIRNIALLEESLKRFKPDYVLHFGELSSVYACDHNPPYAKDINFTASKKVIDLCAKLKIPTLYNSSSSVYGNQKVARLMTEDDPTPEPTDNYCKWKLAMEEYIQEKVRKDKKYKIIVFRPATVCGLAPRMRIDLLPNHFTYCAVANGSIKVGELDAYRAAIDIEDLVDGYFAVIKKGSWKHLIYNIGHHNFSKREFSSGVKSVVECSIVELASVSDVRNLQIDCSRFDSEFEFTPSKKYQETVAAVALWIKENLTEIQDTRFAGMLNMSLDRWLKII